MMEMYLHPVTLIQPSNIRHWRLEGQNPGPKGKTNRLLREFLAEKGHHDCICTADCNGADKFECNKANNNSGCKSDWYSCTCIHPGKCRAYKAAESKLKAQHNNNKHMKCSH
eukprot:11936852-Ditylum_brightwellii.AAC.1